MDGDDGLSASDFGFDGCVMLLLEDYRSNASIGRRDVASCAGYDDSSSGGGDHHGEGISNGLPSFFYHSDSGSTEREDEDGGFWIQKNDINHYR